MELLFRQLLNLLWLWRMLGYSAEDTLKIGEPASTDYASWSRQRLRLARVAAICAAASLVLFAMHALLSTASQGGREREELGNHDQAAGTWPLTTDYSSVSRHAMLLRHREDSKRPITVLSESKLDLDDTFLFIAIFSSHGGRARRDAIRQSWAKQPRRGCS